MFFLPDLFVLITWSFPARGWDRAHLGRKCFPFAEMKQSPGTLKCFSFATWNELLYDERTWIGEESTVRPAFRIGNQPPAWLRKPPSIPRLLQPHHLRSLVFLLDGVILNGKQVSALKKETKGKYDLASPLEVGGGRRVAGGGAGGAVFWS